MKVNVYAEEITDNVEIVSKQVQVEINGQPSSVMRYGIRFNLQSHFNGRSAVTFWVPWTQEGGYDWLTLRDKFDIASGCVDDLKRGIAK